MYVQEKNCTVQNFSKEEKNSRVPNEAGCGGWRSKAFIRGLKFFLLKFKGSGITLRGLKIFPKKIRGLKLGSKNLRGLKKFALSEKYAPGGYTP